MHRLNQVRPSEAKWLRQSVKCMQVGNAVTEGRQIVIGMGSSMLINAAMYAFANASRTPGGMNPLIDSCCCCVSVALFVCSCMHAFIHVSDLMFHHVHCVQHESSA